MKKIVLVLIFLAIANGLYAQVDVYWRSEADNGYWEWGDTCEPSGTNGHWFYSAPWNGNRKRPDCFSVHDVYFDNNNQTSMTLNSLEDYNIHTLTFKGSASLGRTMTTDNGRKIYFREAGAKLENQSVATHSFNVGIVLDYATVQFVAANGNLALGPIELQTNTASFEGSADIAVGSIIQGTGQVTKSGTGTLTFSDANTYTGNTTVNAGTLRLNHVGGTTIPVTNNISVNGGTLKISTNQTLNNLTLASGATLTVDSGAALTITGSFTSSGIIDNDGTIILQGSTAQSFPGTDTTITDMNILTINSGNIVTLDKDISPQSLNINGGTFDLGTFAINRATPGGTLTIADGATLKIGGTNGFPENYDTHSIAATGIIEFNGTAQTINLLSSGEHYGNLVLSGSGIKTMAGNIVVDNNMTLGTGVEFTIVSGANLTVGNQLVNNGDFTVQDNANFIQLNDVSNSGNITVEKNSAPMFRLDYAMWSSPVAGETLAGFSPGTLSNRFYHYNPLSDGYTLISGGTIPFAKGESYLIRVENTHPATYVDATSVPQQWEGSFVGVPHNGDVSVSVTPFADNPGVDDDLSGFNAVGNPYPSAISVSEFFSRNSSNLVSGSSLYFWRKKNNAGTSSYVSLTLSGLIVNSDNPYGNTSNGEFASGTDNGNWVINAGQGFIVKANSGTIVFDNDMRKPLNHNYQFRTAQDEAPASSRLWLNLKNEQNQFGQAMIAYTANTTTGIDYGWDGLALTDGPIAIYSLAGEAKLGIQARASFEDTDEVPMGYKATSAGSYTISIDHFDGVFAQEQDIFLRDNLLGLTHDLKQSAYSFVTEAGAFEGRFDVIYARTLSTDNPVQDTNSIIVYKQNGNISINSGVTEMTAVSIYDTRGRLLYSAKGINATETSITGLQAEKQVLIVNISTLKGDVSKKIIF